MGECGLVLRGLLGGEVWRVWKVLFWAGGVCWAGYCCWLGWGWLVGRGVGVVLGMREGGMVRRLLFCSIRRPARLRQSARALGRLIPAPTPAREQRPRMG